MKDIILVVVILLSVGLSAMVVRFNEKATKATKKLEEERYSRLVAEESLQKNAAKIATYESQLKSATDKMAKIQDILEQEKDVNKDLKKQYEKLSETKAQLEEKLQDTLSAQAAAIEQASASIVEQQAEAPVDSTVATATP